MAGHVLVTGGTGYIGSHTVVLLVEAGYRVTIVDSLCNSNTGALSRIATITGKPEAVTFVQLDLRDRAGVAALFAASAFDGVIHFAALKAVGESSESGGTPSPYTVQEEENTRLLQPASAIACSSTSVPPRLLS